MNDERIVSEKMPQEDMDNMTASMQETDNNIQTESPTEERTEVPADASTCINGPVKPVLPYHERAYLLYGNAEKIEKLDLDGTSAFLQGMGFDGGELRQAREGKELSDVLKGQIDRSEKNCSYCGIEISGVDHYRLPDGRLRCTTCSNTLIKTKTELLEIYNKVISDMETLFNAQIRVPIQIEMLEERKLKKKLKRPLSDVDDNALLILGVAVNKRGKYSIYLENGAPRISAIATFIHELTHIWQYVNWGKAKLPRLSKTEELLVYEGMAKWVEIQYLYLIGETLVAKREEAYTLERQDAYGIGFRLYLDQYPLSRQAMNLCDNPFTTDRYPVG